MAERSAAQAELWYRDVLAAGWVFLFPLALLMTLLFYYGYNPAKSALYAAALMFVLGAVQLDASGSGSGSRVCSRPARMSASCRRNEPS